MFNFAAPTTVLQLNLPGAPPPCILKRGSERSVTGSTERGGLEKDDLQQKQRNAL